MSYIPKSLTNNNLFTNGGEFADPNGKPYSGYYHQLFDGKIYSGKTPLEPTKRLLTTIPKNESLNQIQNTPTNLEYSNLTQKNQKLFEYGKNPTAFIPQPKGEDYKRGQIERYFAKKRNETPSRILEINQSTYNDIITQSGEYNYALWQVVKIFWKISGPLRDTRNPNGIITAGIVDTNERLVNFTNREFRGIKQYLSNLIQFSIKPNLELISNQYTSGNEYTVKEDNSNYIGNYHIMADGTIMDGEIHLKGTGKTLLPANIVVQGQVNTLVKNALGKLGATINQQTQQQISTIEPVDTSPQISTFIPPITTGGSSSY
jgi:hypothetical protein